MRSPAVMNSNTQVNKKKISSNLNQINEAANEESQKKDGESSKNS